MPADFVPFLPSTRAVPGSAPVVDSFTALNPKSLSHAAAVPSQPHGEMKVELKRDGDRITQIRIQCRCGEWIEIDCQY